MNIIAGLTDIPSKSGSLSASLDQVIRIAAPKSFSDQELTKLRRDCEIMLERVKSNPDKMKSMMKLALAGNRAAAQVIAKELKLTEADFESEGGGCLILLLWCAWVVFVAVS